MTKASQNAQFWPGCGHLFSARRFNTYFCNCIFVIFLVSRKRRKRGQSSLSYQLQLQWLTITSTFNQHCKELLKVAPASSVQLVPDDSWNHRHRIVQACGGHLIQSPSWSRIVTSFGSGQSSKVLITPTPDQTFCNFPGWIAPVLPQPPREQPSAKA